MKELSKWFAETADWYVLFVKTYEEKRIADSLSALMDSEHYTVFVPMKDYAYHKQGATLTRKVPWINGYVFVATTVNETECLSELERHTHHDNAVFKVLRNGGKSDSAKLNDHDRSIMRAILDENFNIPALDTVQVGDKLVIADNSPLAGVGGNIVKINKNKQTATVSVETLGRTFFYTVMLADSYKAISEGSDMSNECKY
jgi:transcription antitermination factor NusG